MPLIVIFGAIQRKQNSRTLLDQPPPKRMPETQTFRLIGYRPDGTSTCICVTH